MQKILLQHSPACDNQPHTAGTVPANKQRIVHALTITNLVREDKWDTYAWVKYKLHIVKSGDSPNANNCLAYYPAYLSGQSVHRYEWIRLNEGDYVVVYLTSWRLAVQAFGEEINETLESKQELALNAIVWINTHIQTIAWCVCP